MLSLITQSLQQQIQRHEHTFFFSENLVPREFSRFFFTTFTFCSRIVSISLSVLQRKNVFWVLERPCIFLLLYLEKETWRKTLSVTQTLSYLPVFSINMWGRGRENQLYISSHHVFGYIMEEKSHTKSVFWDWLKNSLLDLKSLSFHFHFFFKEWNQNLFTVHFSKKSESQNVSLFPSRIKVKVYPFSLFTSRSNSCP